MNGAVVVIGAKAELTTEAALFIDELTVLDGRLLTKLELTERFTVEGSKLTKCLTDKLTVLLTVDGFKLVTDEELDAVLFTDELTERLTVDGLELVIDELTVLLTDELTKLTW